MMSNPLFDMLGGAMPNNMGAAGNILQRFAEFQRTFRGDARQQVQQMLNSGRITQEQYNRAVQLANQLQKMMK